MDIDCHKQSSPVFDDFSTSWDTIPPLDLELEDLLTSNNHDSSSLDFNVDDLFNYLDEQNPPPSPSVSTTSDYSSGSSTKDFTENNQLINGSNGNSFACCEQSIKVEAETPPAKKTKTIILPQKDFQALMNKIKNGVTDLKTELGCKKVIVKKILQSSDLPRIKPAAVSTVTTAPSILNTSSMLIDENVLKRQQRMMKNRESASLSRKRKRDHVLWLEEENVKLKQENSSLRSQLLTFAQACQCKHVQISECISNIISNSKQQDISFGKRKVNLFSPTSKKNTAVLLAMVFMVSLNFGGFSVPSIFIQNDMKMSQNSPESYTGARHLLWYSSDKNGNENESDIAEGPMNVSDFEEYDKIQTKKCGINSNQTENMRLAMELQKWIKVNNVHNISSIDESLEIMKLSMNFMESSSYGKFFKKPLKKGKLFRRHRGLVDNDSSSEFKNSHDNTFMNVYKKPKFSDEYSKFFEGIGRRNDTFYVLTFNADNIYLPASTYNQSNRPKMSLMVPTKDFSTDIEQVTLLQIDFEVLNTTQVLLNANAIPTDLKHKVLFSGNKTNEHVPSTKYNNESEVNSKAPLYRPYFIKKFRPNKQKNKAVSANLN